jgi:hypothetical protein
VLEILTHKLDGSFLHLGAQVNPPGYFHPSQLYIYVIYIYSIYIYVIYIQYIYIEFIYTEFIYIVYTYIYTYTYAYAICFPIRRELPTCRGAPSSLRVFGCIFQSQPGTPGFGHRCLRGPMQQRLGQVFPGTCGQPLHRTWHVAWFGVIRCWFRGKKLYIYTVYIL